MSDSNQKSEAKNSALQRLKSKSKPQNSVNEIISGILSGDKASLAAGLTLVESSKAEHKLLSKKVIKECLPHSGKSFRLGITGVPGVGKSTFVEAFGQELLKSGKKIAVLAIDPSSQKTKGSILGDKTRMQNLISEEDAFIRPSPTSEALGGVARATKESIILCEAAGFDFIIIETVGVGQSETEVHAMVDFFLLLMLSGAGDELQGIKRGIMEMADGLLITKADGDNAKNASRAAAEYKSAIHLLTPASHNFHVKVKTCSALEGVGISRIQNWLEDFHQHVKSNGYFLNNRATQNVNWMHAHLKNRLIDNFYNAPGKLEKINLLEEQVKSGELSPFDIMEMLEN